MSGYSRKPLFDKLGYQTGDSVYVHGAPEWFVTGLTDRGILMVGTLPSTWAHLFFINKNDLHQYINALDLDNIQKALWVSWPKKASKVPTDISEQDLRDIILPSGLVDVKVVAVDEIWSGLKFTRRVDK